MLNVSNSIYNNHIITSLCKHPPQSKHEMREQMFRKNKKYKRGDHGAKGLIHSFIGFYKYERIWFEQDTRGGFSTKKSVISKT